MKILYHHRTRATDAQRVHILEMVRAFRALGHEVEIAALVDPEAEPADASAEAGEAVWKRAVRRIPFAYEAVQLGYNLVGLPWLLWKINRGGFDLVYERYSLFNISGTLSARLSRRPVVLEVNSPFALEQHVENDIRAVRFANWTERAICNAATRVLVVSGPLRRIMEANGIDPARLLLLPNGVNLERLQGGGDVAELRRSLGLEDKVVIGFTGWFRAWHGLESLVETYAAAGLRDRAALLLVGDGPAMEGLKRRVSSLGIEDSVVFTGAVAHERVARYLRLFDIAVQPAANSYCCPMKILEYMGLGAAIVAPRQENVEELLRDGKEALLFTPGDGGSLGRALAELVHDKARRRALGEAALAAVHQRGLLWTNNADAVCREAFRDAGGAATGRQSAARAAR